MKLNVISSEKPIAAVVGILCFGVLTSVGLYSGLPLLPGLLGSGSILTDVKMPKALPWLAMLSSLLYSGTMFF